MHRKLKGGKFVHDVTYEVTKQALAKIIIKIAELVMLPLILTFMSVKLAMLSRSWAESQDSVVNAVSALTAGLFFMTAITSIFWWLYWHEKGKYFKNEASALPFIARDIKKARRTIKVVGHGCTNIFQLTEEYQRAILDHNVVVKVLIMDPENDTLMDFQTNLEEEQIPLLLRQLDLPPSQRSRLMSRIAVLPREHLSTRIPILLSIVYGWGKLKTLVSTVPDKRDNLCLAVYSSLYMIKAIIIDDNICYLGLFNAPNALGIHNQVRVIKGKDDVLNISELFDRLFNERTTRHLSVADIDRYERVLDNILNRRREGIIVDNNVE